MIFGRQEDSAASMEKKVTSDFAVLRVKLFDSCEGGLDSDFTTAQACLEFLVFELF